MQAYHLSHMQLLSHSLRKIFNTLFRKPLNIVISKFDVCLDEIDEHTREIAEQKGTADSSSKYLIASIGCMCNIS